ncbi:MAG: hypothetical protein ACOC4G_09020 [Bacillota bacterium]
MKWKLNLNHEFQVEKKLIFWRNFLEINDYNGLFNLMDDLKSGYSEEDIYKISKSPEYRGYLCYHQDIPMAVVIANLEEDSIYTIEFLHIFEQFRNESMVETFFSELLQRAWQQGIDIIYVNGDNDEKYLKKAFVKFNFRRIE